MSTWSPVTGLPIQYSEDASGTAASGNYLKFYASGTTTPISMATDSTGGTTLAKCALNSLGQAINGSSAVFIPHIDQKYKAVLYPDSTTADANTFASAIWNVDGINPSAILSSADDLAGIFNTLATAVAATTLEVGRKYYILERTTGNGGGAYWKAELSSGVTENTYNIVQCTGVGTLSLVLISSSIANMAEWGGVGAADVGLIVRAMRTAGKKGCYFPGSDTAYTWGTSVNVPSNFRVYGDGASSIIKRGGSNQNPIIISTYDFENSDTTTFISNKEDIEIDHLCFDFNFNSGWDEFYVPIQFRGSNTGNNEYIDNIRIHDNYWIDSNGTVPHSGGDSWCINMSASCPERISNVHIWDNISLAENHQFVAGGATGVQSISIHDNFVYKPHANGIFVSGFVSSSGLDNDFRDIKIKDNIIYDPYSVGIAVGPDAGHIVSDGLMRGVNISGNTIRFVTGTGALTGILARGYAEENKDWLISNNTIINESSGTMAAVDVDAFNASIANGTTNGAFTQPAAESTVTMTYDSPDAAWLTATAYVANNFRVEAGVRYRCVASHTSGTFATDLAAKKWVRQDLYCVGSYLRIGLTATVVGGLYRVVSITSATEVVIRLKDMFNYSAAAVSIPDESVIVYVGGMMENVSVKDNIIRDGYIDVSAVTDGDISDNRFSRETDDYIIANPYCHDLDISGNTVQQIRIARDFDGTLIGNRCKNGNKANYIQVESTTDAFGYNYFVNANIIGNNYKITKTTNPVVTGLKLQGNADAVITSRFNDFGETTGRGIDRGSVPKSNIKSYGDKYDEANVEGFPFGTALSLFGTASHNFDLTSVASQDLTMTVTGALVGDFVQVQPPLGVMDTGMIFTAWVSATDTVTVRGVRGDGSTPNPAAGTFKVKVERAS